MLATVVLNVTGYLFLFFLYDEGIEVWPEFCKTVCLNVYMYMYKTRLKELCQNAHGIVEL